MYGSNYDLILVLVVANRLLAGLSRQRSIRQLIKFKSKHKCGNLIRLQSKRNF